MKKLYRALTFLVCLAMLSTAMPAELAAAYASETTEEPIAATQIATVAETTAPEAQVTAAAAVPEADAGTEEKQTSVDSGSEASENTTVENTPPVDAPVTNEPNESAPSGDNPATGAPATDAPVTDAPTTDAPTTDAPTTDAPTTEEPGLLPEEGLETTDLMEEEVPAIDYAKDAAQNPTFEAGFAEILSADTPVYAGNSADDEEIAWIGTGVVYVIARTPAESSKPDRLQVAYNVKKEDDCSIEQGWIDAAAARPMDPAEGGEVEKYIETCKDDAEVRSYNNSYPLKPIACRYPDPVVVTKPEPVTVAISQTSATIGVGDTGVTLGVVFSDGQTVNADGTPRTVQFTSSATKYVTVNAATGNLKGVRAGSATVTATTEYGSVSCKVTVKAAPRSISATPTSAELLIGETTQISPKFASSSYGGSCTYQSGDPSIATVDANGVVTGVSKGKAIIYVYAYNLPSKPAKATVTVYGPATAIDIPEETIEMCTGMERQLSAVMPEFEREGYSFSSDNDQVASVTREGLIYARDVGSATITVTSDVTGVSDSCVVQVLRSPAEENVNLTAGAYKLGRNEKFNVLDLVQVTGDCHAEFTFKSSSTKYAKVDAAGNVTGVAAGSATITITTHNGIVRTVKVTVYKNPTSVAFSSKTLTLGVGMSAATKVTFTRSGTYSQHSFTSSNEGVAKVDPVTGVVTAVGEGSAVITCVPQKGKSGSCTVTVLPAPTQISASAEAIELGMGENNRSVTGLYPAGTMCSFSYASENPGVAAVDAATGAITTVSTGSTNIVVTSHNGVSVKCRVDVMNAPTYVNLSVNTMKLMVGETNDTLTYSVDPGAASAITLSSSNTRYVKIVNGKLVGVKAGTATITAKTYNGVKDTCKVTVCAAPSSVAFSSKTVTLGQGDTAAVTVKFNKTTVYSVCTFESSNPDVATIDPRTGVITANGVGTATLTVTTQNNKKGTCVVNVLPAPESVSVAQSEINVGLGEGGKVVVGQYPEGTMCSFTYRSSNEEILTVNEDTGAITTKAVGNADVYAVSHNNVSAVCRVNVMYAPTSLTLNKTSMKLMVGETNDSLTGTVNEGAASGITLSSSNTRYVKITNGKLVGVKAGTATITAKTYNGVKATCKVTVCAAPSSVAFSEKTVTLGQGDNTMVTVKFNKTTVYSVCTFESSNPDVATIDPETGKITAVGVGTATLTVTTQNNKKGTCTVNVLPAPESVSVAQSEINVGLGESGKVVIGQYPEGTMCSFSYKSRNEAIATVDEKTGAITTKAVGSVDVVVTSHNGKEAVCRVNVMYAPTSLTLNKTSMKLMVGETNDTLTGTVNEGAASGITLSSSNTRYVKITNGKLVGVKAGTATITAKTYNGVKATCKVTVCAAPSSVAFSEKTVTLGQGDNTMVTVKFNKTTVYSVCTFESSNPDVATIDPETGKITAVGVGTATLTVTTQNNKKGTCVVNVLPAPESVSVAQSEINVGLGERSKVVVGQYPEGTMCSFSYKSGDEAIATVDEKTGAITTKAVGSVDVVVTSHNGKEAVCRVNVMYAPTSLTLNKTSMKLMVGETNDTLTGTVNEGAASGITLSSSNTRYVKITNGRLVGVKAGTATITAKTYNGVKATCKVTVCAAPKSVSFKNKSLTIGCGESVETAIVYSPATAYSVCTYTSGDPSVATVDPVTGVITGVKAGTVAITAKPQKGTAGVCTVVVCPAPTSVSLSQSSYEIAQGMSMTLVPILSPGSAGHCSFESSDPSVVSVDANGVLKGVKAGTATLKVTTYNGFPISCSVTVTPAPASLRYDFTKITMLKGDSIQIPEPTAYDVNGNVCPSTYTYSSSSTRYATVSGSSVKGVKTGTITITAKSYNGKTASFKLTIASSISGLTLVPSAAELYTNGGDYVEQLQLQVGIASGTVATLIYTSSDPSIASVTQDGLVTPLAPGTVTITAKAISGASTSATITVKRLSTSIKLDAESIELGEGESYQLHPALDADSTAILTYTTTDESVVSVDENGLMKAVGKGKAIVAVTMQDGTSASMAVNVLPGPTGIRMNLAGFCLAVGESIQLNPELTGVEGFYKKLSFSSSNAAVVAVNENGTVMAVAEGEAIITARTCNGLTDSCLVRVAATAEGAQVTFEKDHYGIICGDTGKLPVMLNKAAIERGYTVQSSNESILTVNGLNVTANAVNTGDVTVTLTVNPVEGEEEAEAIQASCIVKVQSIANIAMPAEVKLYTNSELKLEYTLLPENLIGSYSFAPEDPTLISFDPETGMITSNSKTGTTRIVFQSINYSAECSVTVESNPKYRALVIGSYNNSGASNDLPFASNNLNNMYSTLSKAQIGDETYSITGAFSNPSKSKVQSLITGTFKDAKQDDVSLIYIMSHGYYQSTSNGYYGYYFSLAPNYSKADSSTYVTAGELMSWISGIQGNVILVLDSCKSGGFITDCSGGIASKGNMSVLTAQSFDKNASYYQGSSTATTVEFLTYAFCRGLGVDQMTGTMAAMNADSNGDGQITVQEAFAYARSDCQIQIGLKRSTFKPTSSLSAWMAATKCIKVPGIYTQAAFDAWSQTPQIMMASNASDLVFYAR